ncbi:DUF2860 family protein [Photobacterium sp. BZF1]|uniref:DUF2860 family protein n=1 Tax=Photobacterium sp. BZF1 TaxID=1904457 RepID=UPI001653CF73|nr:DUF2860 family protein [Photobacterium sp. BZF1]MBC7006656.1 DUF2860 family protein [Photobacterium sp. BZF1]
MRLAHYITLSSFIFTPLAANAIDPIPKESGFSGYVNLGAGGVSVKSNELASAGFIDLSEKSINSYGSAKSESSAMMIAAGEISYTFAETGTQIFIGNRLEDYIRFDLSTFAGVRQNLGKAGVMGASVLYTAAETEVWSDPFKTGGAREETGRTANGYRLIWDKIYGTGLELRYSYREIEIDNEQNGQSLNLSDAERTALNRNGDNHKVEARYQFSSEDRRHIVTPEVSYTKHDTQGKAMAWEGYSIGANYIYTNDDWRFVTNVYASKQKADEANPVFGEKADSKLHGVSVNAFYSKPFGLKNWTANAGVAWFEDNNDISFYDSQVLMVNAGMLYRF